MISHVNVISHVLMVATFESQTRSKDQHDVVLGLLPQSHIYGLVVICHDGVYRGDSIIVLPKFELLTLLESIQRFRINVLILVCICCCSRCLNSNYRWTTFTDILILVTRFLQQ